MPTSATSLLVDAEFFEELGGLNKLGDCCSMLGRRGVECSSGTSQNGSILADVLLALDTPAPPSSYATKCEFCSSGGLPRNRRDGLGLSSFLDEFLPVSRPAGSVRGVDDANEADAEGFRTSIGDVAGETSGDGLISTSEACGGWMPRSNTSCDDGSLLPRRPCRILDCC